MKARLIFIGRVLSIILLVCSSISCFRLAVSTQGNEVTNETSNWSFIQAKRVYKLNRLDARIEELQNALEFMVWPGERKKIFQQLTTQLHEKQTLAPYTANDTLRYLALAEAANFPEKEKIWSLQRALTFNVWSENSRYVLLYYCIDFQPILTKSLQQRCDTLLTQLSPARSIEYYARLIGVGREALTLSMERAGWEQADEKND